MNTRRVLIWISEASVRYLYLPSLLFVLVTSELVQSCLIAESLYTNRLTLFSELEPKPEQRLSRCSLPRFQLRSWIKTDLLHPSLRTPSGCLPATNGISIRVKLDKIIGGIHFFSLNDVFGLK